MLMRFAISAAFLGASPLALADVGANATNTRARTSPYEIEIRAGESMGLYGRWAKLDMRALYGRTALRWNERLRVGRKLGIRLRDDERARFDAARDTYHRERASGSLAGGTSDYTLRAGDNPWRIARRLAVPVWTIEQLNAGTKDWRRLKIGDVIKVPASRVSRR